MPLLIESVVSAAPSPVRSIVQINSLTVQRFRNTYKDEMDTNKYNKYVDAHF